jgi:iduronate 2-sulfatase
MRCPLMVRLPGHHKVTGETEAIAESLDIYPTLCEFAGLAVPDFLDGDSLVPVIEGKGDGKEAAFSQIRPVNRKKVESQVMAYSVRTKDFRYVEWRNMNDLSDIVWRELYDHRTDPQESISVADNPEYAGVMKRHAKLVAENYGSLK